MAPRTAGLQVSFVIRLYRISLGAFDTFPLLLGAMLSSVMLLDTHEVAESVRWVVMKTRPLRTDVNSPVRY